MISIKLPHPRPSGPTRAPTRYSLHAYSNPLSICLRRVPAPTRSQVGSRTGSTHSLWFGSCGWHVTQHGTSRPSHEPPMPITMPMARHIQAISRTPGANHNAHPPLLRFPPAACGGVRIRLRARGDYRLDYWSLNRRCFCRGRDDPVSAELVLIAAGRLLCHRVPWYARCPPRTPDPPLPGASNLQPPGCWAVAANCCPSCVRTCAYVCVFHASRRFRRGGSPRRHAPVTGTAAENDRSTAPAPKSA